MSDRNFEQPWNTVTLDQVSVDQQDLISDALRDDDDSAKGGLYVAPPVESDADRLRNNRRNQYKAYGETWASNLGEGFGDPTITRSGEQSFGGVYGEVPAEEAIEGVPPEIKRMNERMPPEFVSLSMITDDDIRKMAESNTFPDALKGTLDPWWFEKSRGQPVEGQMHSGNWERGDPLETYRKLDNKYDREDFLVGLRYAMKKKVQNEKIPEWMLYKGTAWAGGVALGALIAITGGAAGYAGTGAMFGTGAATGAGTAAFGAAPFLMATDPKYKEARSQNKAAADEAQEKRRIKKMTEDQLREELEAEKAANELLKQSLRTQ